MQLGRHYYQCERYNIVRYGKQLFPVFLMLLATPQIAGSESQPSQSWIDANISINQIQVLGSHNSYKIEIDPGVLLKFATFDAANARALDYGHIPLEDQLNAGLRQLELDVYFDPKGGLYALPIGEQWITRRDKPFDSDGLMKRPGFKVLHLADVDYRSHCLTLKICLDTIKQWSDDHPRHVPIAISLNLKDSPLISVPGHVVPEKYTKQAFDALESEILEIFDHNEIITPDQVKSSSKIPYSKWPKLGAARGKVLMMLDAPLAKTGIYMGSSQHLDDRLLFVTSAESSQTGGYAVITNPVKHGKRMARLVSAGWLLRTMSEQNTVEARALDYTRATLAFASGAQYISTDYYLPDKRFGRGYHIGSLPGGSTVRCNPVNAPPECASELLDPYVK